MADFVNKNQFPLTFRDLKEMINAIDESFLDLSVLVYGNESVTPIHFAQIYECKTIFYQDSDGNSGLVTEEEYAELKQDNSKLFIMEEINPGMPMLFTNI